MKFATYFFRHLFILFYFVVFVSCFSHAKSVILMIGDGMGKNHLSCVSRDYDLFLMQQKPIGEITTFSFDHKITDSAAAATAYSCGEKTKNGYLGVLANGKSCETIAEKAIRNKFNVYIRTTDEVTGATPAAFYAHNISRANKQAILLDLKESKMNIKTVDNIANETNDLLKKAVRPFFILIEESEIDKQSHKNDFKMMKKALISFDKAVKEAYSYVQENKDTTLIVLSDHETGGLSSSCVYKTKNHTARNIDYYVFGSALHEFSGDKVLDNTDIYKKINSILFEE